MVFHKENLLGCDLLLLGHVRLIEAAQVLVQVAIELVEDVRVDFAVRKDRLMTGPSCSKALVALLEPIKVIYRLVL